jgi:nicotinamide-nucleotide amidase
MPGLVERLNTQLAGLSLMLVTAESCTGGMIGAAMTDRAGASIVYERGFITYSNEAKIEQLGVPPETLKTHGAVSAETALAMARGALNHSRAELVIAVTGIAGPDGGSPEKPVGTVFIAYGMRHNTIHCSQHHFAGDRAAIRQQTVETALQQLTTFVSNLS